MNLNGRVVTGALARGGIVVGLLLVLFPVPAAGRNEEGEAADCILHAKVDSFSIQNGDMEEALTRLRRQPRKVLVAFEKIPHRRGEKDQNITLEAHGGTVGDILEQLCRIDTRCPFGKRA